MQRRCLLNDGEKEMLCDICNTTIDQTIDYHYLLLKDQGRKYEGMYDHRYHSAHSDHENSIYDVFLCPECCNIYIVKVSVEGWLRIPSCIPLRQSKKFILAIFRRSNVKHRIKG